MVYISAEHDFSGSRAANQQANLEIAIVVGISDECIYSRLGVVSLATIVAAMVGCGGDVVGGRE